LRGTNQGALWVAIADASGDPITSFGGGTEYTEDVATANPQVGKAIMVERDDALTTVSPAEGDWEGLRGTAEGALWVQDFNSDAILADTANMDTNITAILADTANMDTNLGTVASDTTAILADTANMDTNLGTVASDTTAILADTAAIQTAVEIIDDIVKTEDALHSSGDKGVMSLGVRADADGTLAGADGDYAPLQVDANGYLKVEVFDGGDSHTIDGNVGDNGPGFTPVYKYLAKSTTADATLWNPTDNYLHITDVIISISGTATDVTLGFGAGTTLEETILKFHGDVRGGLTHHFRAPLKSTDSGDNLNIALSAAQAMTITVCGYETST
jgi:hypothetical protein